MNPVGSPDAINQMANVLENKSEQLRSVGRRLLARAEQSRGLWECDKAKRFRGAMEGRQQQTEGMANELHNLSVELKRLAIQVQNEIAWLHGLERKVHDAISAAEHGAEWALERGVDITRLPARGDPAWQAIAKNLRI